MATTAKRLAVVVFLAVGLVACKPAPPTPAEQCRTEKRTLATAVAAFRTDEGRDPVSTSELVPAYLKRAPTWWSLSAGGAIVPSAVTPPAGCT